MIGISTYCLLDEPLPVALDRLSGLTGLIEVMDEGPHFVDSPELFESYSGDFIFHAPYHGMNIACLFEAVRSASVEVMTDCFARAAEIGAAVVLHPGYFAWEQEREQATGQFVKSLDELSCAARDLSVAFSFENMGDMNFFNLRTRKTLLLSKVTGSPSMWGMRTSTGACRNFLTRRFAICTFMIITGTRTLIAPWEKGTSLFLR